MSLIPTSLLRLIGGALSGSMLVSGFAWVGGGRQVVAAAGAQASSAPSPGSVGTFLYNFSQGPLDVQTEARRRKAIALNAGDWNLIAKIKAVNPDVKVLVYKDLSSTRDWDCTNGVDHPFITSGVGYCYSNAVHPEWFLTDRAGARLTYQGWPGHWQMDVGNASYQQAWVDNVRAELLLRGWDGVLMDNALTAADNYHPGVKPANYPDDAPFQDAYKAMLQKVGAGIRGAGRQALANINETRMFPGLWSSYTASLSGGAEEHFINWNSTPGTGYIWDWGATGWTAQVGQVSDTASTGKVSHFKTKVTTGSGDDIDAFRYGLASFLLASDGRSLFGTDSARWAPEFDWNLGTATSASYSLGGSVNRRDFSAGTVIANASPSTPVTVNLGRQYLDADNRLVSTVTVGALRGVVLRTPATTPTTVAPTTTTTVAPTTTTTVAPTTTTTVAPVPTEVVTTMISGRTVYSDGTTTKSGRPGTTLDAFALAAFQNLAYRLVLSTDNCRSSVAVLNPTSRYANTSGSLSSTRGTIPAGIAPGQYTICFRSSGSTPTATSMLRFTVR